MSAEGPGTGETGAAPPPGRPRTPLPTGYRQAIVSAVTVLLGFSLLFLRFFDFELSGSWNITAYCSTALLCIAIVLQLVTLWRALQVKDDDEIEYGKTLRWFLASIILLLLSLTSASIYYF